MLCSKCGEPSPRLTALRITLDGVPVTEEELCTYCVAVVQVRLVTKGRGAPV